MIEKQPPPDMDVEPTFDRFVECFGGELVRKSLPSNTSVPRNADYFFARAQDRGRVEVFRERLLTQAQIGKKVNALLNQWQKQGRRRAGDGVSWRR